MDIVAHYSPFLGRTINIKTRTEKVGIYSLLIRAAFVLFIASVAVQIGNPRHSSGAHFVLTSTILAITVAVLFERSKCGPDQASTRFVQSIDPLLYSTVIVGTALILLMQHLPT